jgi:3-phosphoshikimate 1-carboxyvinyltransferase
MSLSGPDGEPSGETRWRTRPGATLGGELRVPGDKSISHRALLLGAIAEEPVTVRGLLEGEDCRATRRALEALGASFEAGANGVLRTGGSGPGGLSPADSPLDLGNSGTGMRLLCGLLAGLGMAAELTGDASLIRRPMARVAEPLRAMGAVIETACNGRPPLRITGGRALHAIDYAMPVASAQVKSAVLIAGLFADGQTRVTQPALCRDHTERMLRTLGVAIEHDRHAASVTGPARLRGGLIEVPGDFSSAAFFIVAALLAAPDGLVIRDVGVNPTRTGLIDILRRMGGRIELENPRSFGAEPVADIRVERCELTGIDVPAELVAPAIDEFPVLFVAAAAARGRTRVTGAEELRVKETDRIATMAAALRAVGVDAEPTPDGMIVKGGRIRGGSIDSGGDHRVAMAMAVAGLMAEDGIEIGDTRNVATSFPGFVPLANSAGFRLEEDDS